MGESHHDQKRDLRKRFRTARRAIAREVAERLSAIACERLQRNFVPGGPGWFIAYAATDGEIDPHASLATAAARGMMPALPRQLPAGIEFSSAQGLLQPGPHAIVEPAGDAERCPGEEAATILVPGVAFDAAGHRLGRGGGHYDRALLRYPQAVRIGFAFELQMVDAIPADPWDIPMHFVVTEARVVAVRGTDPKEIQP